jgi:hypothetical protein
MSERRGSGDVRAGLSEGEMRRRVIDLAFGSDPDRLDAFCRAIKDGVPEGTSAVLRGSAVTGKRHDDGAPFDADGPGTSDLDLTLVGAEVLRFYTPLAGFYIPGVHSKPLSEKDPDIAPELRPLRRKLMLMAGRPVNIQGTRDWIMFFREHMMRQPYLTLVGRVEDE